MTARETARAATRTPRPRRIAPAEVRKRQLIEATIESIARHGLSGTTMTTVTGLADLSLGIVGFYFKSKENLLVETLAFLAEEHRALWRKGYLDAGLSPEAKLWAVVEAHFDPLVCTRRKLAVWFAFFGDAHYRKLYRERVSDIDAERWEETRRLCRMIKEEGGYADIDPMEIAKSLEGLNDGLWINMMMYPDEFPPGFAKRQVQIFLARTFPRHFALPDASAAREAE